MVFNKPVEMRRNLFNVVGLNVKLLFSVVRVNTFSTCPLSLYLGKKCHNDMFQTNLIVAKLLV